MTSRDRDSGFSGPEREELARLRVVYACANEVYTCDRSEAFRRLPVLLAEHTAWLASREERVTEWTRVRWEVVVSYIDVSDRVYQFGSLERARERRDAIRAQDDMPSVRIVRVTRRKAKP